MKLTNLSKERLVKIAQEEYGLATDGLTKKQLLEGIGETEIPDELYNNYFPVQQAQGTVATPDPMQPTKPLTVEEQLARLAEISKADKAAKEILARRVQTDKFLGEPFMAPVRIERMDPIGIRDMKMKDGTIKKGAMVTIHGLAYPETANQIGVKLTTAIEYLKDFTMRVGETKQMRIGLLSEIERNRQAKNIIENAKGNAPSMEEALAIVGYGQLIVDSNIMDFSDMVINNQIKSALQGGLSTIQDTAETKKSVVPNGQNLRALLNQIV